MILKLEIYDRWLIKAATDKSVYKAALDSASTDLSSVMISCALSYTCAVTSGDWTLASNNYWNTFISFRVLTEVAVASTKVNYTVIHYVESDKLSFHYFCQREGQQGVRRS